MSRDFEVKATQQEACYAADRECDTASAGSLGSERRTGSDVGNRLRKQLFERRRKLMNDLQEVESALNALDTDETVQKVFRVLSVAESKF